MSGWCIDNAILCYLLKNIARVVLVRTFSFQKRVGTYTNIMRIKVLSDKCVRISLYTEAS